MWKWSVLCVLVLFWKDVRGDIRDQMTEVMQRCCNEGSSFARSHSEDSCSSSQPVPPGVAESFTSLCVIVQAQCCKEYFQKKKDCDAGIAIESGKKLCNSTKDSSKACCDEYARGTSIGRVRGAAACVGRAEAETADELLADDAYVQCCLRAAKEEIPSVSPPITISKKEKREGGTLASVCEEYAPNELCAHHCIPIPGSYKCECNPGFVLMADGRNCKEAGKSIKNRCKPRNPCQHKCNDNGVQVMCSCRRGYELMPDARSCQDIDECALDIAVCRPGTECHNVPGSYRCIPMKNKQSKKGKCPPGFIRNELNNVCDDINECKLPHPPCPSYLCENTVGGYKCGGVSGDPVNLNSTPRPVVPVEDRCPPGFALGSRGECEDVDECATSKDDCNPLSQFCINTHSSFFCQDKVSKLCRPGFKIDPRTGKCEDINECEEDDLCRPDQICINQLGQYDCKLKFDGSRHHQCPEGMRVNPSTLQCEDIDECLEGTHLCDQHQNCHNTNGSYVCHCKLGYELDTFTGACVDVNECATGQHDCITGSQRCDNTVGSYLCIRITSCGTGYILQHSTGNCEDVDECALGIHNCLRAGPEFQCLNIPGSFRCVRKRVSTTTTTAMPEYEYVYYDSDEEFDSNETMTDTKPVSSAPAVPSQEQTPTSSTTPKIESRIENTIPEPDRSDSKPEPPRSDVVTTSEEPVPTRFTPEEPRNTPEPPKFPEATETTSTQRAELPSSPAAPTEPAISYYEPPQRQETPDSTYYETRNEPERPISNEINPDITEKPTEKATEAQPTVVLETQPTIVRLDARPTYSPYKPTEPPESTSPREVYVRVGEETATVRGSPQEDGSVVVDTNKVPKNKWTSVVNPIPCPPGFEANDYGGCFDIDECATNSHSCSGLTEVCRNTVGGYLCDCASGFRRDPLTGSCDVYTVVSSTTPLPPVFKPEMIPSLPPIVSTEPSTTEPTTVPSIAPTIVTTMPTTVSSTPVSSTTQKSFWGYKDEKFVTTRPFYPSFWCDAGYYRNPKTGRCEDIDECTNGQANCATVEVCVNTEGGYRCECPPNWELDQVRHRCVPVLNHGRFPIGYGNEPKYPPQVPDQQTTFTHEEPDPEITQVEDRGTVLKCPWGYMLGADHSCIDVDECATGEAKCGPIQLCTNLPGGYICSCPPGYKLSGDHACEDVDECSAAGNTSICSHNADCVNTVGSYQCKCHNGFRAAPVNDKVCVDVDECSEARAGTLCQHRCSNVWGSYRCFCHRGYRLNPDNRTCSDVDECVQFKSKIPCVGTCLNEPGSYRCACPPGYRLSDDKRSCIDIDECETGEASCQTGVYGGTSHVCFNTRGSYRCQRITCPPGYQLESKHRCTKTQRVCSPGDWECAHQPTTISYNFITFVSNLFVPESNVKLFTMRGPTWPYAKMKFELRLVNVNAPPSVKDRADINAFLLIQNDNEAVMSLVRPLEGPQSIELELSMELYSREQFGGIAIAKLFIYVSEYEF